MAARGRSGAIPDPDRCAYDISDTRASGAGMRTEGKLGPGAISPSTACFILSSMPFVFLVTLLTRMSLPEKAEAVSPVGQRLPLRVLPSSPVVHSTGHTQSRLNIGCFITPQHPSLSSSSFGLRFYG